MNNPLILKLVSDFIDNQPAPIKTSNSFIFEGGIEIIGIDGESVHILGLGCDGFELGALELREKSDHFNDLCRCEVCEDRGGHDCENRPLNLNKHSVPFKT